MNLPVKTESAKDRVPAKKEVDVLMHQVKSKKPAKSVQELEEGEIRNSSQFMSTREES